MRRLADELDAGTMTLYGYFASRDDLLDALVDSLSRPAEFLEGPFDGPWREELRKLLVGVHAALAEHPWQIGLRLRRPLVSPGAMRVTEMAMQILERAGFSPADAARAYRTLFLYTFGFSGFGDPPDHERVRRESLAKILPLPPAEYPAVSAAVMELAATMAGEEQFEYGLDLILDGLAARRR